LGHSCAPHAGRRAARKKFLEVSGKFRYVLLTHPEDKVPKNEPILNLKPQKSPKQKISVTRMPLDLYAELSRRAALLGQSVRRYCRIVLEEAERNRSEYRPPFRQNYVDSPCHGEAIHIPIESRQFMDKLRSWEPFGQTVKAKIAICLLRKHLEVREW
jgi:hypothetical protein